MHHPAPVRNEVAPGLKKYDNRDAWFYRTFLCLCATCEEELDQMYAALRPQVPGKGHTHCPRHGIGACPDDCPVPMVLPGVKREQATDAVEAELTGYIELDEALKEQAPAERCPGCVADAEPGVWRRIVPHNLDCESKAPAGGTGVSERTAPGRDADPPPNPAGPRILGQLARDGLVANQPPAPAFWCLSDGSCQNGCQGLPCHCDDCEACCGCTAGPAAHRVPRLRAESILSGDARLPGSMSHLPKGRVSGDD